MANMKAWLHGVNSCRSLMKEENQEKRKDGFLQKTSETTLWKEKINSSNRIIYDELRHLM